MLANARVGGVRMWVRLESAGHACIALESAGHACIAPAISGREHAGGRGRRAAGPRRAAPDRAPAHRVPPALQPSDHVLTCFDTMEGGRV